MISIPHVLIAAAAAALWVLSLYVRPFGACPRCHGRGVITRGKPKPGRKTPPRTARCARCKGVGRRQRPGSRTVHQLARRVRRELARQRAITIRQESKP